MLQTTLHKKIELLYSKFPKLIYDQRMLEFILLTMHDDINYVLQTKDYSDLKWLLSDKNMYLNDYRDAPTVESIARAARYVREELGIEDERRKRKAEEMKEAYSTQARLL